MLLDNQDYINPIIIIKQSLSYIIGLIITMVIIIIIGLIYNTYLSYPTILYNIKPKYDKDKLMNELKMYNVIDNNNNDKLSVDIEYIDHSRNSSLFTPSLFKQSEFIDDDDDNISIISSICDNIDILDDNDDESSKSSTRSARHRDSAFKDLIISNTTNNTENITVTSTRKNVANYHYPRDSVSFDNFYGSMQRTINTITGFLKFDADNKSDVENQDLLSKASVPHISKAINLMRTNSKL